MFCSRCGTQLPENVGFCHSCGTRVVVPQRADASHEVQVPPAAQPDIPPELGPASAPSFAAAPAPARPTREGGRLPRWRLLLLAAGFALAGAGSVVALAFIFVSNPFGDDGDSAAANGGATKTPEMVQRVVSESELDSMVLSLADFGPEYSDFELDSDSGPKTRSDRIDDAGCNAQDAQEMSAILDNANWVAGYGRSYNRSAVTFSFGELADGDAISAGTGLDLFSTSPGAHAYLEETKRILSEAEGECEGFSISNVGTFAVPSLGNEALGLIATLSGSGLDLTLTLVQFRREQIAAASSLARKGDSASKEEAVELARKLDARIQEVLSSPPDAQTNDFGTSVPTAASRFSVEPTVTPAASALTAKQYASPPSFVINTSRQYSATISTAVGDIVVQLFDDDAPQTVNNFVFLARDGFYNGLIFHQVTSGFDAQAGDPSCLTLQSDTLCRGTGGPGYELAQEQPGEFQVGEIGMANASQFFIALSASPQFSQYTPFGRITAGLDVAQRVTQGTAIRSIAISEQ